MLTAGEHFLIIYSPSCRSKPMRHKCCHLHKWNSFWVWASSVLSIDSYATTSMLQKVQKDQ